MGFKIVVVEDDLTLQEYLDLLIKNKGMEPSFAKTSQEGFRLAKETLPDCMIVDWALAKGSGLELTKRLRQDTELKTVPILMISGKRTDHEEIADALASGADDFLSKPFDPIIFLSKIQALIRRASWQNNQKIAGRVIVFEELCVNLAARAVTLKGEPVALTFSEFELLLLFLNRRGEALDRQSLLNAVSPHPDKVFHQVIDKHIENLRKKLGLLAPHIQTVRNIGYRFV